MHRTVFLTGALAYLSAPLWLGFLVLSTWLLLHHGAADPQYFVMPHQPYPLWPSWRPEHAVGTGRRRGHIALSSETGGGRYWQVRASRGYGGAGALAMGTLLEIVLSALLAPVRMMFHSRFVLSAIADGQSSGSHRERRRKHGWSEALRRHGLHTAIGIAWVTVAYLEAPDFLPWLSPVAAGLLLAAPLSVLTSRTDLGLSARRLGLLLTPPETYVPREIVAAERYAGSGRPLARFTDAVVDPELYMLVRMAARRRSPLAASARHERVQRALMHGPLALTPKERLAILGDVDALDALHRAVRTARVHPGWTSRPSDSRATIHHLNVRAPRQHATISTLVPRG